MAATDIFNVAAFHETLGGVPTHRLKHPHARHATVLRVRDEQALRQQRFDGAQVDAEDILGRLERASAGEDGQPREGRLLLFVKQRVAPIECRAKGLLPWRRIPRSADKDRQRIVQAPDDLLGSEQRRVRRGEFDGQGHTVETRADLRNRRGVGFVEHEAQVARAAALHEEADRRRPLNAHRIEPALAAGNASGPTTNTCSPASRSGSRLVIRMRSPSHASRRAPTTGGCGEDMLEVVEDQKHVLVVDEPHKAVERRLVGIGATARAAATVAATRSEASVVARETKPRPSG